MSLGQRIKEARQARGFASQQALATELGWRSTSRLGNYEQDTREPSLEDIQVIAGATGVRAEWLAFGSGPMTDSAVRLSTELPTTAAQPVRLDADRLALVLSIVDGAIQDSRKRVPDAFRAKMIAHVYDGQYNLTGDTAEAVRSLLQGLLESSETA